MQTTRPICETPGCDNVAAPAPKAKNGEKRYRHHCSSCLRKKYNMESSSQRETRLRKTDRQRQLAHQKRLRKWYRGHKQWAVDYLGGKCMNPDCPIDKNFQIPIAAFEFHHRDPNTKERANGPLSRLLMSAKIDLLRKELDKCELLCCFCYRLRHYATDVVSSSPQ